LVKEDVASGSITILKSKIEAMYG